jgi:hypothetical protein
MCKADGDEIQAEKIEQDSQVIAVTIKDAPVPRTPPRSILG